MNKKRRKEVWGVREKLQGCYNSLDSIKWEEDTARENIPESLEDSEKYQLSEEWSDALETACDSISEAIEVLGVMEN